jgi:hypothetical protein
MSDAATYRLWVSESGRTLVRLWSNGTCEVCQRASRLDMWGPPTQLLEEEV